jgi:hypothetical protein
MALGSTIDRSVEDKTPVRESHGCLDAIGPICKARGTAWRTKRIPYCGEEKA